MTIGTALVIIAVLYIIERRNLWRKVGVVAAVFVGLAAFSAGGYALYQQHHAKTAPIATVACPPHGDILDEVASGGKCYYPENHDGKLFSDTEIKNANK